MDESIEETIEAYEKAQRDRRNEAFGRRFGKITFDELLEELSCLGGLRKELSLS